VVVAARAAVTGSKEPNGTSAGEPLAAGNTTGEGATPVSDPMGRDRAVR
jgi:hypothetical protein